MHIDPQSLITLWFENAAGERWLPTADRTDPPAGFTRMLHESPLVLHRETSTQAADGWRSDAPLLSKGCHPDLVLAMCRPSIQEANHALRRALMRRRLSEPAGHGVRAMAERIAQGTQASISRVELPPRYTLEQAILIAARSCERCVNALAHAYGLLWGYPEHGPEWKASIASCAFCAPVSSLPPDPKPEPIPSVSHDVREHSNG